ncbi:hypothetical protein L5G32_11025 [Gordonia sp. HY002]|uniref:hypothetical protein n=1 Tax=Gordonia zhenghanii TaxID=2911516 RepID=UPI001EF0A045|nr:hypothetical protein [Gordonia zhenghanii]MCF8570800.1 hypothetical protein [Gordonia zhenghanii]MCF8603765.1 hypothetical protein [Gordonia zhenghanii]
MSDHERDARTGDAATGDPVQDLLLGFATTIDQLAALIGGGQGEAASAFGSGPVPELFGELGTLMTEFGDLLSRILTAFITVLEAVAEMLRSAPSGPAATPTGFESIPVRISSAGR